MNKITIVTCVRSLDFEPYKKMFSSLLNYAPECYFKFIESKNPKTFNQAVTTNSLIKMSEPNTDIMILDDDTELLSTRDISKLQEIAYSDSTFGAVSPLLIRHGKIESSGGFLDLNTGFISAIKTDEITEERIPHWICFGAVFIKREVITKIGLMDENFIKFGFDVDYSVRVWEAGYKTVSTPKVRINHMSITSWNPEFAQVGNRDNALFRNKWKGKLKTIYKELK